MTEIQTQDVLNLHRADPTNAGDWWSVPAKFFPITGRTIRDVTNPQAIEASSRVVIVGGGGLGRPFFAEHLRRLTASPRSYMLIAWGVGADVVEDRTRLLQVDEAPTDPFGDYFNDFDLVGCRIDAPHPRFDWVPCASCMHPAFDHFRTVRPDLGPGLYQHKRVKLVGPSSPLPCMDNSGDNIVDKLTYLARCSVVVTNTYHGVYWATLLGRPVVCLPFKSGLFSFRHRPAYATSAKIDDHLLASAPVYPEALEECRQANRDFFAKIKKRFDI